MQLVSPVPPTTPTPLLSSIGGLLIGASTVFFLAFNGRLIGLSGICEGVALCEKDNFCWKISFTSGLMFPAQILVVWSPSFFNQHGYQSSWAVFVVSGLFVGCGTRLSNGCTSGHGVCGLARLSSRSIAAVLIFLVTAVATANSLFGVAKVKDQGSDKMDSVHPWIIILFLVINVSSVLFSIVSKRKKWREVFSSLFAGAIFSFGLILSGMVQRPKVLNFLMVGSVNWDYSLALVLGFAVILCFVMFRVILRNLESPLLCELRRKILSNKVYTDEDVRKVQEVNGDQEKDEENEILENSSSGLTPIAPNKSKPKQESFNLSEVQQCKLSLKPAQCGTTMLKEAATTSSSKKYKAWAPINQGCRFSQIRLPSQLRFFQKPQENIHFNLQSYDGCTFGIPNNTIIDLPLVIGAFLFGVGWGMTGVCPGPGLLLSAAGLPKVAFGFLPGMVVGMYTAFWLKKKIIPKYLK